MLRSLYRSASETSLGLAGDFEKSRMEEMNAYIGIRGAANSSEFADVPIERMDLYQRLWWHRVHSQIRVPKTRWVVLRFPTDAMAQAANMSSEAFEDFYFAVCTADYARMARDQEPLVRRMLAADRVRLVGAGHRAGVLHPRHARAGLPWATEHPRRRGFYGARSRQREWHGPLQYAFALSGHSVSRRRV